MLRKRTLELKVIWREPQKCERTSPVSSGLIHRINLLSQPTGKRVETKKREKLENSPSLGESYGTRTKETEKQRKGFQLSGSVENSVLTADRPRIRQPHPFSRPLGQSPQSSLRHTEAVLSRWHRTPHPGRPCPGLALSGALLCTPGDHSHYRAPAAHRMLQQPPQ